MSYQPRLSDKKLSDALEKASELIPEFKDIQERDSRSLPLLLATVFDSLAYGELDLDFNVLRWAIEAYAGIRLIRCVDPLLKIHAQLVKKGYSYEKPIQYVAGDRYVGYVKDPLEDWSVLSFSNQHPGFIVLVRQGRKEIRDECSKWEKAGKDIRLHKADFLTREIHIRLADKEDGSLYKVLSHGKNCFLVDGPNSSPFFRYGSFNDIGFIASAKEDSFKLFQAEGAMVHWKNMNRAMYDMAFLIEIFEEVLAEEES
jgi:hypothetical protein